MPGAVTVVSHVHACAVIFGTASFTVLYFGDLIEANATALGNAARGCRPGRTRVPAPPANGVLRMRHVSSWASRSYCVLDCQWVVVSGFPAQGSSLYVD